jgi:acetolactate synthase-1/2/3 large subunit
VFGSGVRLAGGDAALLRAVEALGIPALFTIGGMDLLEENHPLRAGNFGPVGQRRANFALQNADLLLAVGASLSVASVGFGGASFAPGAKRILVNAAPAECVRPDLRIDHPVAEDARSFLERLPDALGPDPLRPDPRWLDACRAWRDRYPVVTPDYLQDPDHVNTYVFAALLSDRLDPGDLVVTGNSLDIVSIYHSFAVKHGQRVYTNLNYGAMGWDLPAAVGAAVARKGRRVVLVTGDGSFQFNLQELLTIRQYQLDVRIFILNNQGYEAIRATQRSHFQGRLVGSDPATGIGNPDYRALAQAYGLHYAHGAGPQGLSELVRAFLAEPGPGLCELKVAPGQMRSPRATSVLRADGTFEARPLEDMFPFLDPAEVQANMCLFKDPAGGSEP